MPRKIAEVDQEVRDIARILPKLAERISKLEAANTPRKVYVSLAADLWPPSDWFRFKVDTDYQGAYWQAAIGPLRLDIFE